MPDLTLTDLSALPEDKTAAKLESATYTVEQLAVLLQCSPRHVWRQIDVGAVPGVLRLGRLVRVARSIADKWISEGCPGRASR